MYLYGFSSVFQGGKSFPFHSESLQDTSMLVSEEVNKGLTAAPAHVLPPAPGLPPVLAPVTVQPPTH